MVKIEIIKERIESVLKECEDIISILDSELNLNSTVSFRQIKEIENSIERLKKQGLTVPDELNRLKLKLLADFDNIENINSLKKIFIEKIQIILPKDIVSQHKKNKTDKKEAHSGFKSKSNYERPLGSKGNSNLEDYLIPAIKFMNEGYEYKQAFHKIKDVLDVRYNTVSSQCTRGIGLSTDEFVSYVESGKIISHLEVKFPEKSIWIKNELT